MRDTENAQIGCEALSVAISEIAEDMAGLAPTKPRNLFYGVHAAKLAGLAAEINVLTAALVVMARHPPPGKKRAGRRAE